MAPAAASGPVPDLDKQARAAGDDHDARGDDGRHTEHDVDHGPGDDVVGRDGSAGDGRDRAGADGGGDDDGPDLRSRALRLAASVAALVLVVGGLAAALRPDVDVPRNLSPSGDAGRSGAVASGAVGPPGDVVWSAVAPVEEDLAGVGTVGAAGDLVLVNGRDGTTALDAASGSVRWVRRSEAALASSASAVVVGGPRGSVLVDPTSGTERYRPVDAAAEVPAVPVDDGDGQASVTLMRTTGRTAAVTTPDGQPRRGGAERGALVGRDTEGRQVWRLELFSAQDRVLRAVVGSVGDVVVVATGPATPRVALDLGLEVMGVDVQRGTVLWTAELGSTLLAGERALALTALVGDRVVHPAPEAIRTVERYLDGETVAPVGGLDQPALPSALVVRDARTGAEERRIDTFRGGASGDDDPAAEPGPPLSLASGQGDVVALFDGRAVFVHDLAGEGQPWATDGGPARLAVGEETVTIARRASLAVHDRTTGRLLWSETLAPQSAVAPAASGGDVLVLDATRRLERRGPDGSVVWTTQLAPDASSPLVVDEALVVTRSERDTLVLEAVTGERRWLVEDREGGAIAAGLPAPELGFDGRWVVLPSTPTLSTELADPARGAPRPRALRAMDAVTGTTAWRRLDDTMVPSGPVTVVGDEAFMAVGDQVHGYDLSSGRRAFAANSGALLHAVSVTPRLVVGAERLDLDPRTRDLDVTDDDGEDVTVSGAVVAVDRATREPAWRRDVEPCLDVVVADDVVLTATTQGVQGLALDDGEGVWGARPSHDPCGALVAADGWAVSTDLARTVSGIDVRTGEVGWTTRLDHALATSPVVAGDEVVLADTAGRLLALDVATGEHRWEHEGGLLLTAPPVVVDGELLVRTAERVVRLSSGDG